METRRPVNLRRHPEIIFRLDFDGPAVFRDLQELVPKHWQKHATLTQKKKEKRTRQKGEREINPRPRANCS